MDTLERFSPAVRDWFVHTFGQPTPPQAQGWPPIQRGEHTLILAPTGSGKTLAAFLWGIDTLLRELQDEDAAGSPGIRIVYVSPLKALNNDIHRNLRVPLAGIHKHAQTLGIALPHIEVAVRSGDTPSRERQSMLRRPPHILITTPESLYLMLTGTHSRELFRRVHTVIVDEIHTLVGNKRGVHLTLSLERLQHLATQPVQRIGLSATIRPLEEAARFLGGNEVVPATGAQTDERVQLIPRPVTIVEANYHKPLDLRVETVVEDFRNLVGGSIWPHIVPRLLALVRAHKTTLIFANNRRLAERTADWLNEQIAAEADGKDSALLEQGSAKGVGFLAAGRGTHPPLIRAHHGSTSREARLAMERDLKEGRLPALVGTSSLELGIDIGSIDLVVQLQSPKSVAQGLQRVGRSGHLVGQTSKGRIFTTFREDVMEAAAIAGGMLRGDVEPTHTPRNPLDVLAQHIVAMVSVQPWDVQELFNLVRRAYAYQDLTPRVLHSVLAMLSGHYGGATHRELRARIAWDQVNDRLFALPGARMAALTNGGTIPDRGTYRACLPDGKTCIGELDEEFVYETRRGDAFMLGAQVWRVAEISDDRVTVVPAPGATPRMPFWHGEHPWRPYHLGRRVGEFRRQVAERLLALRDAQGASTCRELILQRDKAIWRPILEWLQRDHALDDNSAWVVVDYVAGQLDATGSISSDRTIVVELFADALGDPRMVVQSPFGGRVNGPWGLALASALRERTGVEVEVQSNDDGILLRFPASDAEFPLDLVQRIGPDEARARILRELPDSAVFGSQFRQNAARALLLPGLRGGKRTPFWLQRLRARDLLQLVKQFDDFPILVETYRDCLEDVMDLPHLEEVLRDIQRGAIEVIAVETATPSPVAQSLLWDFINVYMYEGDVPKVERQLQGLQVNLELLADVLKDVRLDKLLRAEAIAEVRDRLQHTAPGCQARTAEELAVLLQERGDMSATEMALAATVDPSPWVARLAAQGRIVALDIPCAHGVETRWVAAEYADAYRTALGMASSPQAAQPEAQLAAVRSILERFLRYAGPVTREAIRSRYRIQEEQLCTALEELIASRQVVRGRFTPHTDDTASEEYLHLHTLGQIHRRTLHILRHAVQAVPFAVYADFLTRWQHLHPAERLGGTGALRQLLQQLRALPLVGTIWERDVLPLRLKRYDPSELATLCRRGELVWIGVGDPGGRRSRVQFLFRGEGAAFLRPFSEELLTNLGEAARQVYTLLRAEGALFLADICAALQLEESFAEAVLTELALAGLVTNDALEALRHIVRQGSAPGAPRQISTLEEELAARRGSAVRSPLLAGIGLHRPERARYLVAKRRVRERLKQHLASSSAMEGAGRWAPVYRLGVLGATLSDEERAARWATQLLARHGVVTRASLTNEADWIEWDVLFEQLNRMEMRGEIRRGYFVDGLPGIQFALPEAVEQLRALSDCSRAGDLGEDEMVVLNACDPANLYGASSSAAPLSEQGEPLTFARIPSTWLVLHRGLPLLVAEDTGTRVTTAQGADHALVRRALYTLLEHLFSFRPRVTVETWNGAPVLENAAQALLESLHFYRDYPGMTCERGQS